VASLGREEELLLCSSALGHAHGQGGWPIRAALGGGEGGLPAGTSATWELRVYPAVISLNPVCHREVQG
jgi:hypothetical protein